MSTANYKPARLFTLEEANAMLPLVRAITSDLAVLSRQVAERKRRLLEMRRGGKWNEADPYAGELAEAERELDSDVDQLREYVRELVALGVEPKGAPEGLVDFPSLQDGRIVYLCWKLGEPEVTHWHELEDGFSGRQSLVAGAASE